MYPNFEYTNKTFKNIKYISIFIKYFQILTKPTIKVHFISKALT